MNKRGTGALAAGIAAAVLGGMSMPASAAVPAGWTTSTAQAGYVVPGQALRDLAAGWTQPKVSCSKTDTFARIQVGLTSAHGRVVVGTAVNCVAGKPVGYLVGNMFGNKRVSPGDHVSVTMDYYRGSFEVEVSNDTQGWGIGTAVEATGGPRMTHARFAVLSKSTEAGTAPLTDFGRVTFDGCTVGGDPIADRDPQGFKMVDDDGSLRAVPGSIDGDAFTVSWKRH